jgi:hypothetical protein
VLKRHNLQHDKNSPLKPWRVNYGRHDGLNQDGLERPKRAEAAGKLFDAGTKSEDIASIGEFWKQNESSR